jgi:hypothetical protein
MGSGARHHRAVARTYRMSEPSGAGVVNGNKIGAACAAVQLLPVPGSPSNAALK